MRNLIVMTSLVQSGARDWRILAKICISSILRMQCDAKVVVIKNYIEPLFLVERANLIEIYRPGTNIRKSWVSKDWRAASFYEKIEFLRNCSWFGDHDWITIMDSDCLVMRNFDYLFDRQEDVLVMEKARGRGPIASMRPKVVSCLLEQVGPFEGKFINDRECALNFDQFNVGVFEAGEILDINNSDIRIWEQLEACVIHLGGIEVRLRAKLGFGMHMANVFLDEGGIFLDLLET